MSCGEDFSEAVADELGLRGYVSVRNEFGYLDAGSCFLSPDAFGPGDLLGCVGYRVRQASSFLGALFVFLSLSYSGE